MKTQNDIYCIILAGGKGRRLWPCSRQERPKQFVDFFGTGRTQLQQTFDRMRKIIPVSNIYISTNKLFADIVAEQIPEVSAENIMADPIHRNTAPSVAWINYRILRRNSNANVIVAPSDQMIFNEEEFGKAVLNGFEFVSRTDSLLTLGVKPTRPEPGYGYIQKGEPIDIDDLYKVRSFTEKPEREFARMFMESGEFYWNTGLFMSNSRYLQTCFDRILPEVLRKLVKEKPDCTLEEENKYIEENFSLYPNLSIDYGLLERNEQVYVMRCNFGWADLGTWHSIYEAMSKKADDNIVLDSHVIIEDSKNNIIKLPKDKLCVINGLEGFIVVENDNVLLICKKEDSSALIRKYVNEVEIRKGKEYI